MFCCSSAAHTSASVVSMVLNFELTIVGARARGGGLASPSLSAAATMSRENARVGVCTDSGDDEPAPAPAAGAAFIRAVRGARGGGV